MDIVNRNFDLAVSAADEEHEEEKLRMAACGSGMHVSQVNRFVHMPRSRWMNTAAAFCLRQKQTLQCYFASSPSPSSVQTYKLHHLPSFLLLTNNTIIFLNYQYRIHHPPLNSDPFSLRIRID
jgi:hypothetical protein